MTDQLLCSEWNRILLLGVKIDVLSSDQLFFEIQYSIENHKRMIVTYANLHALNISYSLLWFRDFMNQSHTTFCDGVGIKLAARITCQRLTHRFTPPDFVDGICERSAMSGWRVFFLGAKPGIAKQAADNMLSRFPHLQIRSHHGYFDKTINSIENRMVLAQINFFRPHLLIVGFGMPLQEKWILENLSALDTNVILPAGALFDYLSGNLPRAPRWMTDNGLEWLGRLIVEPRRLWKRYLFGNPQFFWRIFVHHFLKYPLPK